MTNIERSLAEIGDRIGRAREDLRIVEEQVLFQMDVVEEAKTRMLVSETPLADREFRIARDDLERLESQRAEVTTEIAELQKEQDRLLDRMLGSTDAASRAGAGVETRGPNG
jgi:predicted  nucleic acid-binding Zn-ribbon protein